MNKYKYCYKNSLPRYCTYKAKLQEMTFYFINFKRNANLPITYHTLKRGGSIIFRNALHTVQL